MEICSSRPISTKEALKILKEIKNDSFIEEYDQELSKNLSLIYSNLSLITIVNEDIENNNIEQSEKKKKT